MIEFFITTNIIPVDRLDETMFIKMTIPTWNNDMGS